MKALARRTPGRAGRAQAHLAGAPAPQRPQRVARRSGRAAALEGASVEAAAAPAAPAALDAAAPAAPALPAITLPTDLPVYPGLRAASDEAAKAAAGLGGGVGDKAAELASAASAATSQLAGGASKAAAELTGGASKAAAELTGGVSKAAADLTAALAGATSGVGSSVSGLAGSLGEGASGVAGAVGGTLGGTLSSVRGGLEQAKGGLDQATAGVAGAVGGAVSSVTATTQAATSAVGAGIAAGQATVASSLDAVSAQAAARRYGGFAGELSPDQVSALLAGDGSVFLVDIRPEEVREKEGLPELKLSARFKVAAFPLQSNVVPPRVAREAANADELRTLVNAAAGGERARGLARALVSLGFGLSYVLEGGFRGWAEAGLPVNEGGAEYDVSPGAVIGDNVEALAAAAGEAAATVARPSVGLPLLGGGAALALAVANYHTTLRYIGVLGILATLAGKALSYDSPGAALADVQGGLAALGGAAKGLGGVKLPKLPAALPGGAAAAGAAAAAAAAAGEEGEEGEAAEGEAAEAQAQRGRRRALCRAPRPHAATALPDASTPAAPARTAPAREGNPFARTRRSVTPFRPARTPGRAMLRSSANVAAGGARRAPHGAPGGTPALRPRARRAALSVRAAFSLTGAFSRAGASRPASAASVETPAAAPATGVLQPRKAVQAVPPADRPMVELVMALTSLAAHPNGPLAAQLAEHELALVTTSATCDDMFSAGAMDSYSEDVLAAGDGMALPIADVRAAAEQLAAEVRGGAAPDWNPATAPSGGGFGGGAGAGGGAHALEQLMAQSEYNNTMRGGSSGGGGAGGGVMARVASLQGQIRAAAARAAAASKPLAGGGAAAKAGGAKAGAGAAAPGAGERPGAGSGSASDDDASYGDAAAMAVLPRGGAGAGGGLAAGGAAAAAALRAGAAARGAVQSPAVLPDPASSWLVADSADGLLRTIVVCAPPELAARVSGGRAAADLATFEAYGLGAKLNKALYAEANALYNRFMPLVLDHLEEAGPGARVMLAGAGLGGSLAAVLVLMLVCRGLRPAALAPAVTLNAPAVLCEVPDFKQWCSKDGCSLADLDGMLEDLLHRGILSQLGLAQDAIRNVYHSPESAASAVRALPPTPLAAAAAAGGKRVSAAVASLDVGALAARGLLPDVLRGWLASSAAGGALQILNPVGKLWLYRPPRPAARPWPGGATRVGRLTAGLTRPAQRQAPRCHHVCCAGGQAARGSTTRAAAAGEAPGGEDEVAPSPWTDLPEPLVLHVLSFLSPALQAWSAKLVCKAARGRFRGATVVSLRCPKLPLAAVQEAWRAAQGHQARQRQLSEARAACGDVVGLAWLRGAGCDIRGVCFEAVEHSQLAVLEWARDQGLDLEWVCNGAAEGGQLAVLRWARAQTPPLPWGDGVCVNAAARGDLQMLRWARAQSPPAPWDWWTCLIVARHGQLEALRWLRANGCPWRRGCCERAAAREGHEAVAAWIRAQPAAPDDGR
ncbi:hypothetical protein HT031_003976 [Scenedesmus sp. PABB004]|nr:hypothetical protein HT031_003976 [Scenedesmus sp. PABB004]